MRSFLLLLLFLPLMGIAQKKQITLDDIYKKSTFQSEFVPGFITPTDDSLFDPKDVVDEKGKTIETRDYEISSDKKGYCFSMAVNQFTVVQQNPIFMFTM